MTDTTLNPTNLTQIEVGASEDSWGDKLNANAATINGWFDAGPALKLTRGGTGAATASAARTNLGLGSMATQASGSVAITGGTVAGIVDLAVADGGTGASTVTAARSNLGAAASGANSDITSLSALSTPLSVAQGGTGRVDAKAPSLVTGRTVTIIGDLTYTSPSFDGSSNVTAAGTLATVNGNVGTFGSISAIPVVTVNAKGLVTAASNVEVAPNNCVMIGGGGVSGGNLTVTGIDPKYARLAVVIGGVTTSVSTSLSVEYSTNNGSSWLLAVNSGTEGAFDGRVNIMNSNIVASNVVWGDILLDGGSGTRKAFTFSPGTAINALRVRTGTSIFTAGFIYLMAF